MLNQPSSFLKQLQRTCRPVTWPAKFNFHCTHEKEQDIVYVLELINLANLDEKSEPSQHVTHRRWSF